MFLFCLIEKLTVYKNLQLKLSLKSYTHNLQAKNLLRVNGLVVTGTLHVLTS